MTIGLFFDENFSRPMVSYLASLIDLGDEDVVLEHYHSRWRQGVPDDVWIPELQQSGQWTIITSDRGRGGNPKLPRVCAACGITHILLSPSMDTMPVLAKARTIFAVWPDVLAAMKGEAGLRYMLYASSSRSPYLGQKPIGSHERGQHE